MVEPQKQKVNLKLMAKSGGKLAKAGGKILPIFSRESPEDFVNEILREDEYIRNAVIRNPQYKELLKKKATETFKKYRGVIYGSKVVDSWDRVTSAAGLAGDAVGPFSAGAGYVFSALEEVVETIPKGIYALYYLAKTGDKKAIPIWAGAEVASLTPYVGDAIDMTNIYVNRARKITKDKVKKDFRNMLKTSKLEKMAA
jgi:hypothetical protein